MNVRKSLLASMAVLFLPACGAAAAVTPDSNHAGHCVAAFNYAAFWFSTGKINHSGLREAKARALFELDELKRANALEQGKVAAKTLTKAYGADQDVMDKLFLACATRQDRNPAFQNQKSDLMRRAAAL